MPDTDYEYSPPYTIGGLTGSYTLQSPFRQDSEAGILALTFTDSGYIFVSPDNVTLAVTNVTAIPSGMRGAVFNGTTNLSVVPDTLFWALNPEQLVYVNVAVASAHAGLVTIMFRRLRRDRDMEMPDTINPDASEYEVDVRGAAFLSREKRREDRGIVRPSR